MLSLLLFFPQGSFVRYLLLPQLYSEPEAWGSHVIQQERGGPASNPQRSLGSERSRSVEQFLCAIKPVLQGIEPSVGHVKSI